MVFRSERTTQTQRLYSPGEWFLQAQHGDILRISISPVCLFDNGGVLLCGTLEIKRGEGESDALAWTTLGEFDDMCAGYNKTIVASIHNEAGAAGLICRIQNANNTSSQVSVHVPTR